MLVERHCECLSLLALAPLVRNHWIRVGILEWVLSVGSQGRHIRFKQVHWVWDLKGALGRLSKRLVLGFKPLSG